jgi:hypothetical protein
MSSEHSKRVASFLDPPEGSESRPASHPSDHNAVFAMHRRAASESARKARQAKIQSRRARDGEKAKKGKASEKDVKKDLGHEAAFLYPVPLYYGSVESAGCAAFAGGVAQGGGSGGCVVVSFSLFSLAVT